MVKRDFCPVPSNCEALLTKPVLATRLHPGVLFNEKRKQKYSLAQKNTGVLHHTPHFHAVCYSLLYFLCPLCGLCSSQSLIAGDEGYSRRLLSCQQRHLCGHSELLKGKHTSSEWGRMDVFLAVPDGS